MKNKLLLLLLVSLPAFWSSGQERSDIIQQRIEFISEQLESEEIDLTNVLDQLNYYYDHPMNLNTASAETLRSLNLLTDVQVAELQLHILQFGKLISVYELQSLQYWDMSTIQLVLPFVRVDDKLDQLHLTFHDAVKEGHFEWYARYQRTPEKKAGYADVPDSTKQNSSGYYLGNADRYYTRLRYTYRTNLSIGFTAEKDAGEQFFNGTQKGFDFYSAHAFFKGGKYLKSAAVGDYLIQVGQGLNLWSGYAFGKSADIFSSKKSAVMLRPYTSVDENRFLRGAAAVTGLGNFSLLTFYSSKLTDGSGISDSLANDLEYVTTIDLSGLHRTYSELNKKNQVRETMYGGYLQYNRPRFNAGIAAISQSYSSPLQRTDAAYNQFAFNGTGTTSISGDYNWVVKNVNFFGEVAYSSYSNSFAMLHGLMVVLDPRVSVSLIYRNYDKSYYSFYNNGFSEGSNTQNEKGLFAGWKIKLNNAWTLNSYADIFSFPWLKYQVDAPSKGHEFLVQPVYRPNKVLEIYGRFRLQARPKNSTVSDGTITQIENVEQRNYRLNLSYKVNEAFTIKSRLEHVTIDRASEMRQKGWLFTQDLVYRPKNFPMDISLRYALFDTDGYDTRIYSYESNALNVFSVPAYYYQGSRAYVMVRYSFAKIFDVWVKYGTFIYSDRNTISSGPEEIKGNRKSDITIQLRASF